MSITFPSCAETRLLCGPKWLSRLVLV